jgi:biopolymer transport protein ExbD
MRKREAHRDRSPDETGGRRWRRYRTALRLSRRPIEWAPFLNLGLLVLMFQLFSSVFVLQPGVRVDLPVSGFTAGTPYGPMIVTLTQEGMVFFNDERTPLEGLGSAFADARHRHRDVAVTVQADYRVPYGAVIRVMNMALDAGIRTVNLATHPAFEREVVPWDE